jgi:hypothetical protein
MGFRSIFTKNSDQKYEIVKNPVTLVAGTVGCARVKRVKGSAPTPVDTPG